MRRFNSILLSGVSSRTMTRIESSMQRHFSLSSGIGKNTLKNVVGITTQNRVVVPDEDPDGKKARARREMEQTARQHRMLRGDATPEDYAYFETMSNAEADLLKRVEEEDGQLFSNNPYLYQFTMFSAVLVGLSAIVYFLFMREKEEDRQIRLNNMKQEVYRNADRHDALQRELARKILADAGLKTVDENGRPRFAREDMSDVLPPSDELKAKAAVLREKEDKAARKNRGYFVPSFQGRNDSKYDLNAQYKNQALQHGYVSPSGESLPKGVDAAIKVDSVLKDKKIIHDAQEAQKK